MLKKVLRNYLRTKHVNKVWFGRNKGFRYRYNDDYNLDMMLGLHEPNTFEVFKLFIKEGMIVTDIGANIGYFTRFLSEAVGPSGKVFAFEPVPDTYKTLLDTISMNGLKNVYPIEAAVSDTDGATKIYLSRSHYMASLDVNWATNEGGEKEVKCLTLDTFFEREGYYPDFIKLDIEGGGVSALKGMVNCIIKNEPVLFLESHTPNEDIAIGKALSLIPYDVYRVGSDVPVKFLDRDYRDQYGIYGTVIAIPQSKNHIYKNWAASSFQKYRLGQR